MNRRSKAKPQALDVKSAKEGGKFSSMHKRVKVKPNSKFQMIEEQTDGGITVHLKSSPVDGKANEELIQLLAERFDVPKSKVRIKSGLSSRHKLVEIDVD